MRLQVTLPFTHDHIELSYRKHHYNSVLPAVCNHVTRMGLGENSHYYF